MPTVGTSASAIQQMVILNRAMGKRAGAMPPCPLKQMEQLQRQRAGQINQTIAGYSTAINWNWRVQPLGSCRSESDCRIQLPFLVYILVRLLYTVQTIYIMESCFFHTENLIP